jgi:hypothetical protein
MGTITPGMDIRKGFAFNLEFNASGVYRFVEWRVYSTEALAALSGNWWEAPNPGAALAALERLDQNGGALIEIKEKTSFMLNTTVPVTIIPWCKDLPRITGAEPGALWEKREQVFTYRSGEAVRMYFAAPLNEGTVAYGENKLRITGQNCDAQGNPTGDPFDLAGENAAVQHYKEPVWNSQLRAIVINPGDGSNGTALPPQGILVTLSIGTGVQSASSQNGLEQEERFTWRTGSGLYEISAWSAAYDYAANKITVNFGYTGTAPEETRGTYSVNQGTTQTMKADGGALVIENVPRLNSSGVQEGSAVSGVSAYVIYLEMLKGGISEGTFGPIKIWNFGSPAIPAVPDNPATSGINETAPAIPGSGMSVSNTGGVEEISAAEDFKLKTSGGKIELGKADVRYVLVNDIVLETDWTPVGSGSGTAAFQGKFYGAGHTISVNGDPQSGEREYTGPFEYVSGADAEIRDLCVVYTKETSITRADNAYVGGLVAYVEGGAKLRNIVVKSNGTAALNISVNNMSWIGGIAGLMRGEGTLLDNAYGGLKLNITSNNECNAGGIAGFITGANIVNCVWNADIELSGSSASSLVCLGGIAGNFGNNGSTPIVIRETRARGNIIAGAEGTLFLGGFIGSSYVVDSAAKPLITSGVFEGSIRAEGNSASDFKVGGFIGQIGQTGSYNGPELIGCRSRAVGITVSKLGAGDLYLGGFAGYLTDSNVSGCSSESPITLLEAPEARLLYVGGFIGYVLGEDISVTIESCYATAPVSVRGKSPYAGGLIGGTKGVEISRSYATGNISAWAGYISHIGGLVGYTIDTTTSRSWAGGSVELRALPGISSGTLNAGGLIGYSDRAKIENCYALGNVLADNSHNEDIGVYAGGNVGRIVLPTKTSIGVATSFAAGNVTARSANTTGSRTTAAGGIVGRDEFGTVQECVALGEELIVKGAGIVNVGRVFGDKDSINGLGANNYAQSSMRLGKANGYYGEVKDSVAGSTAGPQPLTSDNTDLAGVNGKDTSPVSSDSGSHKTSAFWQSTVQFPADYWDFSGAARGYPKLKDVGGQYTSSLQGEVVD